MKEGSKELEEESCAKISSAVLSALVKESILVVCHEQIHQNQLC